MPRFIVVLLTLAASSAGAQATRPSLPGFVVGVWRQPADSLPKWKARGINTLIGCIYGPDQAAKTAAEYVRAAHAQGMYVICPEVEGDAFEQMDEPDGKGVGPEAVIPQYQAFKNVDPSKYVFLNLDGARAQWTDLATYVQYGAGCDLWAVDYYPIGRGDGLAGFPSFTLQIDKLKQAAPGKRVYVFVECADQRLDLSWLAGTAKAAFCRGPGPAEMNQETDLAIAHGASGIIYFPDVIGAGWIAFDGTPDANGAAMTARWTPAPMPSPATLPTTQPATQPTAPATQPVLPDVLQINTATYRKVAA